MITHVIVDTASYNKDNDEEWELEVYRNTHNLCVYCGEPMKTTIYHDVPVCFKHYLEHRYDGIL